MDQYEELVNYATSKKNMFLQKMQNIQAIENSEKIEVEQNDDNDFIYQADAFRAQWPSFTHFPSQYQGKIIIYDKSKYENRNDILAATLTKKRQVVSQRIKKYKELVDQQDLNIQIGRLIRYQTAAQHQSYQSDVKDFYFDFNATQQPRKVKFSIDEKKDSIYAFPGQIIAAIVERMTDNDIEIQKLLNFDYQDEIIEDDLSKYNFKSQLRKDSIVALIAAGPFEKQDRYGYKSFFTFIDKIKRNQICCDVLILLGPIVDSKLQQDVDKHNFEYEEFLENILQAISEELKKVKIIVVNSTKEINSLFPVPQPPLGLKLTQIQNNKKVQLENVKLVGNPCFLEIEEMRIGIINEDVLSEINSSSMKLGVQTQNRIDMALRQIIDQRSFVPVFPTKFPTDWSKAELFDFIETCPDVIISPSNFAQFAKQINQTLFINPHYFNAANQYAILTYNGNNQLQVINKLRVDFEKL